MSKIYTVQELVQLLKGNLETRFPFVWVRGQVSNLSRPGSGHVYFTLKDENSCLDAVWFRQAQLCGGKFNPLTGEVYENDARLDLARTMQNGEDILCAGKITVYPPQGRMQLLVELADPVGVGLLQQEFERLKKELWARGWFDLERKRPLPANPARVAVVTAPGGAVIHDFLRIAGNRGYGGEIRIYPSLVQGEGAPDSIAAALNAVFAHGWAEVAVLIRGGGSLEDLWAFNSEKVAETII
ncbi:MAG: exodeoxyribonuclease VII large subunit, partial [Desulfovibrionaceae bacterium]|nr:exodeoxyribonuclease VII large subunit [Desulfovibrionaceae bacterium]